MYIASDTAGFTCPELIGAIKKITSAKAAPMINGLPPLAKMARMKKKAPMYSARYEAKVTCMVSSWFRYFIHA